MRYCRAAFVSALVTACHGPQSALDPAGRGAERIASLFWWTTAGALAIWIAVVALTLYSLHRPQPHTERKATLLIIAGGFIAPTAVLTIVLIFSLALLPGLLAGAPGALQIRVSGEQWWWRVQYVLPGGETVELANEIRLPVGERVEVTLVSPDVIHSFWIPPLAGKIDMIPGRVNRLTLEPTRTGVFRGVCAEYCGTSHALMAFDVVVLGKDEFRSWLDHQKKPGSASGQERFLANGCGACHTIRGTEADGVIGPDLTHVGSRMSLGSGILPNEPDAFVRFVARTEEVKPGVLMPAFGMLPEEELRAIAEYLEALQ